MAYSGADRDAIETAVLRGHELLKNGQLDDAQQVLRAALTVDAAQPRVLALLGLAHFRAGQFDDARAMYEQLVEQLPADASHRLNLGLAYLKLGDASRAVATLETSRALDPSQGRAVRYLGLAYARAGQYGHAYRAFLLAGQVELANEIAPNVTQAEREAIDDQLRHPGTATSSREPRPTASDVSSVVPGDSSPHSAEASPLAETRDPADFSDLFQPSPERSPPPGDPWKSLTRDESGDPGESLTRGNSPTTDDPWKSLTKDDGNSIATDAATTDDVPSAAPAIRPSQPLRNKPGEAERPTESGRAVPAERIGRSRISTALRIATPSMAGTAAPLRDTGGMPPIPLSQFATDALVRPDEGTDVFEISDNGALVIRVVERLFTRLDGVRVAGGDLAFAPTLRRARGRQTASHFSYGGAQLHTASGRGYLIATPGKHTFTAVLLDDDILYLREDLVFAFEAALRWENGTVPGLRSRLPLVQFRGDGAVALRCQRPLLRIKLPAQEVVFVDAPYLAGWIGRVIPRAVAPTAGQQVEGNASEMRVECTGEGIVLVDPCDPTANAETR